MRFALPARLEMPRLPGLPLLLNAGALLLLGAALVFAYIDAQADAERRLALRAGPPAPVAIERFMPGRHAGLSDEVAVLARLGSGAGREVTWRQGLRRRAALVYPLLPAGADAGGAAAGFLVLPPGSAAPETAGDQPVLIAGRAGAPHGLRASVVEGFDPGLGASSGVAPEGPPFVTGFTEPREMALARPLPAGPSRLLFIGALLLFALRIGARQILGEDARRFTGPMRRAVPSSPSLIRAKLRFVPLVQQQELQERAAEHRPREPLLRFAKRHRRMPARAGR